MAKNRKARQRTPRLAGPDANGKPYIPSINLRSIDGHIARTANTVTAWYRLAPQRWSFRIDSERRQLIDAIATQYAELQGRWLHIRVTNRPYPVSEWARAHARLSTGRRLPDVPGAPTFADYLTGEQRQLHGQTMSDKEVYLGIEVSRRTLASSAIDTARPVLRKIAPSLLDAELQGYDAEIAHLDRIIAANGLSGRPVTADEMRRLMMRSCTLGLPASRPIPGTDSGEWATSDLAGFCEAADAFAEPYAPTVTVRGRAFDLAGVERHVAVLSVGLMQPLEIPEVDRPWMANGDQLGLPLEWSARIYVRHPEEVKNELTRQVAKVASQVSHFEDEHGLDSPQELARQAALASHIEDELSGTGGAINSRVRGWWRVAVPGRTRKEALSRAEELREHYSPRVELEHPEAQYHLWREFIPGEPVATTAHQRRGSVRWAAAAVPTATAAAGDRRGILLGDTVGTTRQPVAWDPWMAQEVRNRSGLTAMVAGLGGGKSFLGGGIVYKTLRAGAHWTVLDPSGPLARLCELPELRPYSRVINLLDAEPGILNPYRVIAEPQREHFQGEPDPEKAYRRERLLAQATRRRVVEDVLVGVLPYELATKDETRIVLKRAVRDVGGQADNHPGMVIQRLLHDKSDQQQHARSVYEFLDDMRDRLSLLIPEDGHDPYDSLRDARLTVLTMPGLVLPREGVPREHWTDAEALGVQLLSLAAWLTQRNVYTGPADHRARTGESWQNARKGVWIDEAFFLTEVPVGKVLMNRFARDSRKWNVRVLLSSQVPADFLKMDGFQSLVDAVFVGRLDGHEAQADALQLLKTPTGVGYEDALAALAPPPSALESISDDEPRPDRAPRQFVFADGNGGIERIRVDFSGDHLSGLREVLDTTPGSTPTSTTIPDIQSYADNERRSVVSDDSLSTDEDHEGAFDGDLEIPEVETGDAA